MKKKLAAASIALALVLGACSGKTDDNENNPADGEETPGTGSIDHGPDGEKVGYSLSDGKVVEAKNVPEEEKKNILDTFSRYIETLNEKDVDGYLETLSGKGYDLDEERKAAEDMLAAAQLKRETSDETIVKYSEEEAQVFATIKTTFTDLQSGAEDAPEGRQVTVLHKENGAWKVFSIHFIGNDPDGGQAE